MNFLSFEYFSAVAHASSIREAAEKLHISQQALSEHIRRLETELDVALLTDTRPAALTPCGKRFAEFSAEMLSQRRKLERDLAELTGQKKELLLSIPASLCPPFLADVIARFTELEPGCMVQMESRADRFSLAELRQYDLNLSDTPLGDELETLQIHSRHTELPPQEGAGSSYMAVAVRKDLLKRIWGGAYSARLEQLLSSREPSLLKDVPFIRSEHEHMAMVMERFFIDSGFSPTVVASAQSSELCATLCRSGAGAFVGPEGWLLRKLGGDVETLDILVLRMNQLFPSAQLYISYQKGKKLSPQEQRLIALICEAC